MLAAIILFIIITLIYLIKKGGKELTLISIKNQSNYLNYSEKKILI